MPRGIYIRTEATRASHRKRQLGKKLSLETRLKVSKVNRKRMHDPDVRQRHLKGLAQARKNHGLNFKGGAGQPPVPFVAELAKILEPAGFIREYPLPRHEKHACYRADFAHVEAKVIIECDGSYHCTYEQQEKDRRRDAFLKSLGWHVIRVKHD